VADLAIGAGGRFAPPRPAWLYDGAPQDQTCHGWQKRRCVTN